MESVKKFPAAEHDLIEIGLYYMKVTPRAFLCHASEDDKLARRIAEDLQKSGIDTFFDDWSIVSGDSLRQKIDEGLAVCTHFIVLLTQTSIDKPWVKAEIDAAFVKKVQGSARLIPLRYKLNIEQLPPLLAGLLSPKLDDYDEGFRRLVNDIHDIPRHPPLGPPPLAAAARVARSTLPLSAQVLAWYLVEGSEHGREGDPQVLVSDVLSATGLSQDDLQVAVAELEQLGYVKPHHALGCPPFGYRRISAREGLFIALDGELKGWRTHDDALRILVELINSKVPSLNIEQVALMLGWPPRRINPALSYLINHQAVRASYAISYPYRVHWIQKTGQSLAFLKRHE